MFKSFSSSPQISHGRCIIWNTGHGGRDSLRIDIPKDRVPEAVRRQSGKKYFFVEGPEFMDVKPAVKIIDDALAAKSKTQ
jgi:hypothetical protein